MIFLLNFFTISFAQNVRNLWTYQTNSKKYHKVVQRFKFFISKVIKIFKSKQERLRIIIRTTC